jgi:tetratricopeptide (TPR) repeat protein
MQVGSVVAGRYAIESLAGTGGMCSVFRARDRDGGTVAVKALHQRAIDAEERFVREARMLQDLRHPAIVRYLDSGADSDGGRFLVMEWLEGQDLEALIRGRTLSLGDVLTLIARISHALGAAHARGIVHRDVKPSNIFIVDGDVRQAKLLDFGVARWGGGRSLTVTGTSVGTPAYMAPEQVRGEREVDARADIFALGCVMYECLTGDPAFVAHNPMAVFCKILVDKTPRAVEQIPGLPEPVDGLLMSMLAKDPGDRPRDGNVVASALDSLADRFRDDAMTPVGRSAVRKRKTITGDEQRLVNVIVAGATAPNVTPELSAARTMRLFPARMPALEATERVDVRYDALGDGSLVVLLEARGIATDQAVNAARYALAMREEVPACDIALATGLAVVGKTRLVGEAIDRACQLLLADIGDRPPPRPIRLDSVTAGLIGGRFEIVYPSTERPLLLGERPQTAERTLLGRPTSFVGRARELAMLASTLEECVDGKVARAVLVTGGAGSGKSRLLRELLKQAGDRRIEVWIAHSDAMRAGSPLDMISDAVRRAAGVLEGEPPPLRRGKLRALVARHVAHENRARVLEFLGELVGLPPSDDDSEKLRAARQDPLLMSDQLRRAIEDLLDAHTRDHPVLLALEDLHWGDPATVAVVDRALRNLGERPLLVVALARPELHDQFPRIWAAHNLLEVRLGPLPRKAAQALAEQVLGEGAPAARVAELVDRADGNPFYLEELLRTAAAGTWASPETVLTMMQARIEALEPEARRVLRAASIFGGKFWRGGVVRLLGDSSGVDDWLETLVARELISIAEESRFAGERAYRFRHDILRDAAYSLLLGEDRRLGHSLAAEWLEAAGETDARALAEHYERGGVATRALPLYARAAEVALERGDFAAVIELAGRADRLTPDDGTRGLLRSLQADAHYWRGEHAESERGYADALELLPSWTRRWYHALGNLIVVWSASESAARMEELAQRLLAPRVEDDDRVGRLGAQAITAGRLSLVGRNRLASELLERTEHDPELVFAGAMVMGHVHRARATRALMEGNPALFLREMERAARRFAEIDDGREVCFQRANIGYSFIELGRPADAERELRAAIASAERMGLDYIVYGARSNLGMALARLGRLRDARAAEQMAASFFENQGDRRLAGASRMYLATIGLLEGDLVAAERDARAALAHLESVRAQPRATLARILLARGARAEALEEAGAAYRQLAETAVFEGDAMVRLVYAETLLATDQRAAANLVIATARAQLRDRAARIGEVNGEWQRSFLEDVPDHARTLELAHKLSAG